MVLVLFQVHENSVGQKAPCCFVTWPSRDKQKPQGLWKTTGSSELFTPQACFMVVMLQTHLDTSGFFLFVCLFLVFIGLGFFFVTQPNPKVFLLQVKHLKDLEKEKDVLCCGLEILEKTQLWYLLRLEGNRSRRKFILETKRELGCSQVATLEVRGWYFSVLQRLWHPHELLFWGCYYINTSLKVREMIKEQQQKWEHVRNKSF